MANEVQIIIRAIDKASAEFKKVGGASGALSGSLRALGAATAVAGAAVGTAAAAYKTFVAPIIAYNKTILEASRATGMGIEAFSRMAEVADDSGVSLETFETALKMMTKRGLAPTIDSLAWVADKANAMRDPVQRAAYLVDIFGRNWTSLNPLLVQGGQAMKKLAADIEDGLVVTQKEADATEELRLRIEKLTDAWIAYRNEIGLGITKVVDLNVRATQLTNTWAEQRLELDGQKPTLIEYMRNWHLAEEALRGANGVTETGIVKAGLLAGELRGIGEEIKALPTVWSLTLLLNDQGLRGGGIGGTEGPGIGGMDQRAAEEYARYRENIRLQGESQRRAPNELAGTQGEFGRDTARPTGEFTGGNTPNDNAWRAYWDMMSSSGEAAKGQADDIVSTLNAIQDKTVTVTILEDLQKDARTYWEHGAASGADFVVPPGYPNDSYRMGVQSGEHVQVTPAGQSGGISGGMTINVMSSPLDTQFMVKQIKAAVGM
jgi:hypothetical protein